MPHDFLDQVEPTEYEKRLDELQADFDRKKSALIREIALKNNPYKVGDVVTDHMGSIRIESIGVSMLSGRPSCFYNGVILTKQGEPSKLKHNKRAADQSNLIK
jgi:hypothetical protein